MKESSLCFEEISIRLKSKVEAKEQIVENGCIVEACRVQVLSVQLQSSTIECMHESKGNSKSNRE